MNFLSCNMVSYGNHTDGAFQHLMDIGVRHVEIADPGLPVAESLRKKLEQYNLSAMTVASGFNLADENVGDNFSDVVESAEILGAKVIYTALPRLENLALPLPLIYGRLRQVGDAVARKDIKVSIETHPDLMHNGDVMLETMKGVNHPNICINFDTGNIYFYNKDRNAVDELKKAAKYVASVHLKDSYGEYWTHNFPTLGEGVVDFAEVFRVLNNVGFYGPFTMELEGLAGENLTEEETKQRVAKSVEHIKQLGFVSKYGEEYYTSGNYENYLRRKFYDLAVDLSNEIHLTPDKEVVDYGCGYGGVLDELWNMGFDHIYGTDISTWVIDYGKAKFPHIADKLHYHNMDRLTKRFDHLFLLDVLEHMPETEIKAILNLANVREFIIARIPVSAIEGEQYVLDASNRDTTHICCHTREWWIDFFSWNGYEFKGDIKRDSLYSSDGVLAGKWTKREPSRCVIPRITAGNLPRTLERGTAE